MNDALSKALLTVEFTGSPDIKTPFEIQAKNRIDFDSIKAISKKLDPLTRPRILGDLRFENWYEYVTYIASNTEDDILKLYSYSQNLDAEIIEEIELSRNSLISLKYDGRVMGNKDLVYITNDLIDAYTNLNNAVKIFRRKYEPKYKVQFHYRARKKNRKGKG